MFCISETFALDTAFIQDSLYKLLQHYKLTTFIEDVDGEQPNVLLKKTFRGCARCLMEPAVEDKALNEDE